jgi:AcrR family transcriptional regulator
MGGRIVPVPRWKPDAEDRLRRAAIDLFAEFGYLEVTVAQIAERAGLTRRTFFRYFPDKREVLFPRSDDLATAVVSALGQVPAAADASVLARTVLQVFAEAGEIITRDREAQRRRALVIDANPDLQERERSKLARTAVLIGQALTQRGLADGAVLGATTVELFRAAYRSRIDEHAPDSFAEYLERGRSSVQLFFSHVR